VNPYFQSFSCVLGYYQYPISTWSKSITFLIIKLMSNSYHLLSISIHVSLINYDAGQRIESSSPRSSGDWNRFGPVGVSLPHDICRSRSANPNLHISTRTQIPQNLNRSALPGSTIPTTLHCSSMMDSQKCVTRYSNHLHSPSPELSFQVKDKPGQRLIGVCGQYWQSLEYITSLQRYGPQLSQAGSLC
jgi:hypothetical protein